MTRIPNPIVRRRRGLTLIEAALVLGIVTLVFGGLASMLGEASETQRAKNVAEKMKEILAASEKYMNARASDFRALPVGTTTWIPVEGNGYQAGFPALQEAGLLPPSFRDYDAYNQHHILLVRVVAGATAGEKRIEAMLSTLPMGNTIIPLRMRGRIARMIGSQGGYCQGATPGSDGCVRIAGVGGGWTAAATDWAFTSYGMPNGSIQALINVTDGSIVTDYLNRNKVGPAGTVSAANTMNTTIYSNTPGDFAMRADPSTGQTTLQIGPNVTIPGTTKVGACTDSPTAAGDLVACNNVVASKFIDRDNKDYLVDPDGTSRLKSMDITDTVVFTTESGDRLENNDDIRLRDLLPRYVAQDGYIATSLMNRTGVPVPACSAGGTPRIFLSPMQDSFSYDLNNAIKYKDYDDYLIALNGKGGVVSRPALVNTTCREGGCTSTEEGFVSDQMVGTRKAIASLNVGSLQLYRQYAAEAPASLTPGNSWVVKLQGSDFARQSNGQPVPWQVLATTYCFY